MAWLGGAVLALLLGLAAMFGVEIVRAVEVKTVQPRQ